MRFLSSISMKAVIRVLAFLAICLGSANLSMAQDIEAGEKVFKKCKACHAVGADAKNKVGPHLNDLFGRTAGSIEGYKYSKAMTESGESGLVWDDQKLDEFLLKPKDMIKKTKMTFPGLKKDEDRANVIAYLATFSKDAQSGAADGEKTDDQAKTEESTATKTEEASVEIDDSPPEFTEAFMADAANIEAGKEMWFDQCTHCHGFKAYPGKAPKLKPKKYKPEFVYKRVFKGFKKMPAWNEVYTKEEIMQIVSYIKAGSFSP